MSVSYVYELPFTVAGGVATIPLPSTRTTWVWRIFIDGPNGAQYDIEVDDFYGKPIWADTGAVGDQGWSMHPNMNFKNTAYLLLSNASNGAYMGYVHVFYKK